MTRRVPRYLRYRRPADPRPEPEPAPDETAYTPYGAPPELVGPEPVSPRPASPGRPAAADAAAAPVRTGFPRTYFVVLAMVVVSLIGGGAYFRAANGPVEVETPTGVLRVTAGSIQEQLEEKRALYTDAADAADLESVGLDDTAFTRTAVVAFGYFLTDLIIAAGFGVDKDTAVEYAEIAADYERLLLGGDPLGDDIEIRFSEDRAFVYDGETGDGGYVDPRERDRPEG